MTAALVAGLMGPPTAAAGPCERSCPAGTPRDAKGCCIRRGSATGDGPSARKSKVTVKSSPRGATLYVPDLGCKPIGVTPWAGRIPRGAARIALVHPERGRVDDDIDVGAGAQTVSFALPAKAAPSPTRKSVRRRISVSGRIQFTSPKRGATLRPGDRRIVFEVVREMALDPSMRVQVGAHTDSRGENKTNAELTRARARAVRDCMIDAGIEASRITAASHGESRPIASNRSKSGREQNRRVEFLVLAADPPAPKPEPKPAVPESKPPPTVARADLEAAKQLYAKGAQLYQVGRFHDAAAMFERSYAASKRPALLYNIAQAYRQAGDCKTAILFFRRFIAEDGASAARTGAAEALRSCEQQVAADAPEAPAE